MEQPCQQWTSLHVINAVFCQPMETFQKQQKSELCNKTRTEVISKNCECQAGFCNCIPWSLNQMLKWKTIIKSLNFKTIVITYWKFVTFRIKNINKLWLLSSYTMLSLISILVYWVVVNKEIQNSPRFFHFQFCFLEGVKL